MNTGQRSSYDVAANKNKWGGMMRGQEALKYVPLRELLTEYVDRNTDHRYKPVAVGRHGIRTRESIYSKELAKDYSKNKLIYQNTLTVGMGSVQIDIGILSQDEVYSVSPAYHTYRIQGIGADYLRYCLEFRNADMFARFVKRGARQGKTIDFTRWLCYEIPVYETNEQERIVATLECLDNIVRLHERQLKKLDQLVKARFVELFGDPVLNPMGWEESTLSGRCEVITGNTPPRVDKENYGAHIEWIKSDNINTPSMYLTKATEYLSDIGMKKSRHVEAGSILMTCIAGSINCIGNVAVADRPVTFNQQINAIVPGEDEPLYLYVLMLLSKPLIHRRTNLMLKGILSKNKLCAIKFPFPPLSLQKEFSSFVSHIESLKSPIRASLSELQTLKKSLMQAYFA